MRPFPTIIVSSLLLAGCAGNYDKLADAHVCEPSMPPSPAVISQFAPLSNVAVPGRSLLGSGKLDNDDTLTYACIDPTISKTNAPQVPNLHKIRLDHLSAAT